MLTSTFIDIIEEVGWLDGHVDDVDFVQLEREICIRSA